MYAENYTANYMFLSFHTIIGAMGFPTWTLIGMGITSLGALLMIAVAYLAQSPRLMARIGLSGARLDLRVRAFTGYALAFLLLAFGFFMAGVPLGSNTETAAAATPALTPSPQAQANVTPLPEAANDTDAAEGAVIPTATFTRSSSQSQTPESGAFGGAPAGSATTAPAAATESGDAETTPTATQTPRPTTTATATPTPSATATPTPTPTTTPTPTLTPTPIDGETAVIRTGGSTLWVRRAPGGQQLTLVRNGEVVILEGGYGNQGGIIWREIRTVDGVRGWVQAEFVSEDNT